MGFRNHASPHKNSRRALRFQDDPPRSAARAAPGIPVVLKPYSGMIWAVNSAIKAASCDQNQTDLDLPHMKRIVHLGLGNFHRAHQAWYTAKAGDWKITGVVMRNAALYESLTQHNNAYVLGTWSADGLQAEVLDVYDDVLLVAQDPRAVTARIADLQTHVVTLTITEKGYALRDDGAGLNADDPAIAQDLNNDTSHSAIGLLCDGLAARAAQNGPPLTVISCDNLSDNGAKLQQIVTDYLTISAPQALPWLTRNVTFPITMVDRITPKLSAAATAEIQAKSGTSDLSIVGTEDFTEWVITDTFAGPRPAWDTAGALFVDDVTPFEARKLRLLNASHSFLAYAGQLAGHTYVHEAIADPALRRAVNILWDEAASTIPAPAAATLDSYRAALLARFAVPDMRHALAQIAMDGSLKLRERLAPIITARAAQDLDAPQTEAAIDSWIAYVTDCVRKGTPLQDPNADTIAQILSGTESRANLRALVGLKA